MEEYIIELTEKQAALIGDVAADLGLTREEYIKLAAIANAVHHQQVMRAGAKVAVSEARKWEELYR